MEEVRGRIRSNFNEDDTSGGPSGTKVPAYKKLLLHFLLH